MHIVAIMRMLLYNARSLYWKLDDIMKYEFKPLGILKTDILDEFYRQVEEHFHMSGCNKSEISECCEESCWCVAAIKLEKKEEVSVDDIGVLLCEAGISTLLGMSVEELHGIYSADIKFRKYLNEWSSSLDETAKVAGEMESTGGLSDPAHDDLAIKASEISTKRIALAGKILGRPVLRDVTNPEAKRVVLATDIFLQSRHHPFYAELAENEICVGTTVSEVDIVLHLYTKCEFSPRQIWELWQYMFADIVTEFLPMDRKTLDMSRKIEDKLKEKFLLGFPNIN